MHHPEKAPSRSKEYLFDTDWFVTTQPSNSVIAIREPDHDEDVFSYAIDAGDQTVLIDSGMGLADIRKVLPHGKRVKLLLTHSHWDHIGGAPDFHSVAIFNTAYSTTRLRKGWQSSEMVGFEPKYFKREVPDVQALRSFFISPVPAFRTFTDGEVINIGEITVQVIHTPGHTPDSVCFYLPDLQILFCGDTLYPGPQYLHLPESSVVSYLASLEKLASLLPPNAQVMCGHNQAVTNKDLLERHIAALKGLLPPSNLVVGVDEFGSFTQLCYDDFSLKLPTQDTMDQNI